MFIKRGDGKILSVVEEDNLEEESKKLVKKVSKDQEDLKEKTQKINKNSNN